MNILHLLYQGKVGGIEQLNKDIGIYDCENNNSFIFIHSGGELYEEMHNIGCDVLKYDFQNNEIIKVYRVLKSVIEEKKIDVVVLHFSSPLLVLPILMLISFRKIKVILYVHNTYEDIVKRSVFRKVMYDLVLKKAIAVIAISDFVKNTVTQGTNVIADKVFTIYNGVDISKYKCDILTEQQGEIGLVFVGRLIKEKGIQVLIEALSLMRNHVCVDIVGDGPYRTTLMEKTIEYNVNEQIVFHGMQRNIKPFLDKNQIFVHPAIWEEGFGITIVEAMSAGLVCVAFEKGAIPEIIENNKSGFIAKECSAKALADKLDEVLEKKDLAQIADNAIRRAEQFSIDRMIMELNKVYKYVIN